MMPFAETFTVYERTKSGVDSDGNDVYSEAERTVHGAFAPAGSSEQVQGQALVTTFDTLYLVDGDQPPRPQDQMLVREVRRDVQGIPSDYLSPFSGWHPGAVVQLKVVTG